jgi:hypothetical protein
MQLFRPGRLPGQLAVAALPGVAQYDRVTGQLAPPAKLDAADTEALTGTDVDGQPLSDPHAGDPHRAAVGRRPLVGELDPDQIRWWYMHFHS